MISHEHRCIFVHIPKTAGNSINRVFGVGWEDHKDLQRYFDEQPREVFAGYFKFAIVRNPWDRLLSDYNYQVKKGRAKASKLFVFTADGSKRNFAQWVETALSAPDRYDAGDWGGSVSTHINRWSPQVDWITVGGETRTDFVARLEHLSEDFQIVCERVGLEPVRLPHRNRRLHWHYSHYYDRATVDLVAAYYAHDIEQFGYEFERAFFRIAINWPGVRPVTPIESAPRAQPAREEAEAIPAGVRNRAAFLTAMPPPTRRRSRNRLPFLAAAATLVLCLGIFVRSSIATTLTSPETASLPHMRSSVRDLILRSGAPVPSAQSNGIFVRLHRLRRTMTEARLSIDFLSAAAPGGLVTFSTDSPEDAQAYVPASAPISSRSSGSGPAPHWWLRRNRENQDD